MDKAGNLLKLFLDKQSIKTAQNYSSFFRSWESIAGEDAAAHSRIVDIQKGTLLVEVDHPAWIQIIQIRYREILNKVQSSFPELTIEKMHLKLSGSTKPVDRGKPGTIAEETVSDESKDTPVDNRLQEVLQRLKKSIDDKEKRSMS